MSAASPTPVQGCPPEPAQPRDRGSSRFFGLGHGGPMAPSWPLYATEVQRATLGFAGFVATAPAMHLLAPGGDGHPVLVLPGLFAGDDSTGPLRALLRSLGYRTYGWRLGQNTGSTRDSLEALRAVFDGLYERYQRPISVIGWSLGGMFARDLARERPDQVRQVIMLGTPFRLAHPVQQRSSKAFERYSHLDVPVEELPAAGGVRAGLPVPSTSVYSTLDGVVSWQACLQAPGPLTENIAVYSSHLGLGHDPAVLWAVTDRLAVPQSQWRPFVAPWWGGALFPRPAQPVTVMV